MTGNELIKALQALTPEELALPVVHIHTEYNDADDSVGWQVDMDIDRVCAGYLEKKYGQTAGTRVLIVGY